jgi:hypothetical protein
MSLDRFNEQIARATQKAAQFQARQLLREMREASRGKAKERQADLKRRLLLGGAVVDAGCGDWPALELTGLLLDGREQFEHSPTQRLSLRKRAQAHLGHAAEEDAESAPIRGPPDLG